MVLGGAKLTTTGDGGLGFGVHREDKVYPNNGFRTGEGIGQIYLQSDTIYYCILQQSLVCRVIRHLMTIKERSCLLMM